MLTVRYIHTEQERQDLYRFRYQIYVKQGHFTDQADHQRQQLSDAHDDIGHHFALFQDDTIVGSIRLLYLNEVTDRQPFIDKFGLENALAYFQAHEICTTSRFMIAPELRNGRATLQLIQAALAHTQEHHVRLNYGDCSPHLVPFYEHLGYRRYREGFNDTAYGYKVPILMLIRDQEYLQSVKSLMRRLLPAQVDDAEARDWFATNYPDYVQVRSAGFMEEGAFLDLLTERLAQDPTHAACLLHKLTPEQAARFLAQATLIPFAAGDHLVRRGDTDNSLFVLLKGAARVYIDRQQAAVAELASGDTFGEIGFLTTTMRTADVIADMPGEMLVLNHNFLQRILANEPEIAAVVSLNLAKELAARLATRNQLGR